VVIPLLLLEVSETATHPGTCELPGMKRKYRCTNAGDGATVEAHTERNVKTIAELENKHAQSATRSDRVARHITRFCGTMNFLWFHVAWCGGWIAVNMGMGSGAFDPYPFSLLTLIVTLEILFLSTFILITENRQARASERRSHLALQINLLTEQENTRMLEILLQIARKLRVKGNSDGKAEALKNDIHPERLASQIDETMEPKEKPPRRTAAREAW
jgi:uncharacterized membrane protein